MNDSKDLLRRHHFSSEALGDKWRFHYLWNGVNHAPALATGLRSTQGGQVVFFCSTLSLELPHKIWVGLDENYPRGDKDRRLRAAQGITLVV